MLEEIKIEVTDFCYRNCIHCSTEAVDHQHQELDVKKVKEIIKEAREMGFSSVVFTGGEATLWPYLKEAIVEAKELGLKTKLYTMCYRNIKNINLLKELNDNGLDQVIYSTATDLISQQETDEVSLANFFNKLQKATNQNLQLSFHHVITNYTKDEIYDIAQLTYDVTEDNDFTGMLSFLRYVPHGRSDSKLMLTKDDLEILKNDLVELKKMYGDRIRIGSPHNILNLEHTPCTAASKTMVVGVDGNVYPCDATKYFSFVGVGGNVMENSLQEIYDSEYFQSIREYKDYHGEKCQNCQNFSICQSGCFGQKMVNGFSDDELTFAWYERNAKRTMVDLRMEDDDLFNAETGLVGETGELIDAIKKWGSHNLSDEGKMNIKKTMIDEIGDIVWYIGASLSAYYNLSLNEIVDNILEKKKFNQNQKIDRNLIKHFATSPDPQCPFNEDIPEYAIKDLDDLVKSDDQEFNLKKNWKKEIFHNLSNIINSDDKETVRKAASNYLLVLTKVCHKVLGHSLEEVLYTNIARLRERYANGFDEYVAEERVVKELEFVTGDLNEKVKKL